MPELITNSRMRAFSTCQRLHQISYVLGYRPIERSYALDWGTLMHRLLEVWWKAWLATGKLPPGAALDAALLLLSELEAEDTDKAKARVVMAGYDARWSGAMVDIDVLAVEQEFNYDSGRGYNLAGKIDGIIRLRTTGQVLILEHKNTSADFGPADSYWTKLRMEPQVSQYFRGALSLGYEPAGCLWDVLRRPEIKPYKATKEIKFKKDGQPYANQRLADETPAEFADRLAGLILTAPQDWYARQIVVRLQDELEEFDLDTQAVADGCMQAVTEVFTHHAPRNPDACARFGRICEFFPVCSGAGSLSDESKYRKTYNVNEELSNV